MAFITKLFGSKPAAQPAVSQNPVKDLGQALNGKFHTIINVQRPGPHWLVKGKNEDISEVQMLAETINCTVGNISNHLKAAQATLEVSTENHKFTSFKALVNYHQQIVDRISSLVEFAEKNSHLIKQIQALAASEPNKVQEELNKLDLHTRILIQCFLSQNTNTALNSNNNNTGIIEGDEIHNDL